MIIVDDQDPSASKTASTGNSSAVSRPPDVHDTPPPYSNSTRESDSLLPPPVVIHGSITKEDKRQARRRAKRRFGVAACSALVLYGLLAITLQACVGFSRRRRHSYRPLDDIDMVKLGGDIVSCTKGSDWSYNSDIHGSRNNAVYATVKLDLPQDLTSLFIRSPSQSQPTGALGFGEASGPTDRLSLDLLSYATSHSMESVMDVCLLTRGISGEYGLVFVVANKSQVVVSGGILFPAGTGIAKSVDVDMPNFQLEFGLREELDNVTVRSSKFPVHSAGLNARHLDIRTSNGSITGVYTAEDNLQLHSIDSFMEVTTILKNRNDGLLSSLNMTADNGQIAAKVHMKPKNETSHTGGSFNISAQSSRGHLTLSFDEIPLDAVLQADITAEQGSAITNVAPAYQGSWHLLGQYAKVDLDPQASSDPWGLDRRRRLVMGQDAPDHGLICWVDSEATVTSPVQDRLCTSIKHGKEKNPEPIEMNMRPLDHSSISIKASNMAYLHFL